MISSDTKPAHRRYTFGDFTLDLDRGALLRRGEDLRLRPQSYEVLCLLLLKHGQLVTKAELQTEVWGNKIVTDDSLAQCLIDIRKALGDSDRSIIRTVPRRGYIFDATVTAVTPGTAVTSASKTFRFTAKLIVTGLAALAVVIIVIGYFNRGAQQLTPPNNSVAVLPFVDSSDAQNQRYLSEGLSEDIRNSLAQDPKLRVIARTSSIAYSEHNTDLADVQNELNIAYVLTGRVHRDGIRLTISAELVNAANGSHVWSQTFERRPQDTSAIEKMIVAKVTQHITPDSERVSAMLAQRNVSANELLWLARYYEHQVRENPEVDEGVLEKVINLYRDATVAAPDSAEAHSRLASALLYRGDFHAAKAPLDIALKLNPDLSEVHDTLGKFYWAQGKPEAGTAWKQAVDLNPNNADALSSYAYWTWMQGSSAAERPFRKALALDPLSLSRLGALGTYLGKSSRIDETLDIIQRIQDAGEIFDQTASYRLIARLYELIGRIDQSIAWTIRARDLEPENVAHSSALAELYADIGDHDTALSLEPEPGVGLLLKMRRYKDVVDIGEWLIVEEPADVHLRYLLAFAYNVTGESAAAIETLSKTGLPGTAIPVARQPIDMEALTVLIDALDATGSKQLSMELANQWMERQHIENANWWIHFYRACPLAILGRRDEALAKLESVAKSPRLPWYFLVRDARCLQRLADEPRYQAVLETIDRRRAAMRAKLPQTLRANGVSL